MRVNRTTLKLSMTAMILIATVALSACVRPAPDMVDPAANATPTPNIFFEATIPPLVTADPGSFYPAPGLEASPTPSAEQPPTEGETAPPAEPTAEAQPPAGGEQSPPPAEQTTGPSGETIHVVQPGDNLFRIGLRYGFTAQELAAYNGIPNVNLIYVGQEIRIPPR
jgi:LysM repeat protein